MELHHLHVAQLQPRPQRHGKTIHRLVTRGGVVLVHGRPATGGHQHRLCPNQTKTACAHVDKEHARERATVARGDEANRAVFLQLLDRPRQNLLHQTADDFYPGQVALVDRAVGGLPGKRLLMDAAIGVAVKETADLVLKLVDTHHRLFTEFPRHILIGQPFAALYGVHEMPLDAIAPAQRHVIATLHHARAAAFPDEALDGNGNPRASRCGLLRMKRCEKTCATGADNQDVGIMPVDMGHQIALRKNVPDRKSATPTAPAANVF